MSTSVAEQSTTNYSIGYITIPNADNAKELAR